MNGGSSSSSSSSSSATWQQSKRSHNRAGHRHGFGGSGGGSNSPFGRLHRRLREVESDGGGGDDSSHASDDAFDDEFTPSVLGKRKRSDSVGRRQTRSQGLGAAIFHGRHEKRQRVDSKEVKQDIFAAADHDEGEPDDDNNAAMDEDETPPDGSEVPVDEGNGDGEEGAAAAEEEQEDDEDSKPRQDVHDEADAPQQQPEQWVIDSAVESKSQNSMLQRGPTPEPPSPRRSPYPLRQRRSRDNGDADGDGKDEDEDEDEHEDGCTCNNCLNQLPGPLRDAIRARKALVKLQSQNDPRPLPLFDESAWGPVDPKADKFCYACIFLPLEEQASKQHVHRSHKQLRELLNRAGAVEPTVLCRVISMFYDTCLRGLHRPKKLPPWTMRGVRRHIYEHCPSNRIIVQFCKETMFGALRLLTTSGMCIEDRQTGLVHVNQQGIAAGTRLTRELLKIATLQNKNGL